MAYVPKTASEILKDLVAATVARSDLTDVSEGSVLSQLLSTVASELAGSEYRMSQIRDSFNLSTVSAADLEERVSEMPLGGVSRLPASAAVGSVMTLTRTEASVGAGLPDVLVVPAGASLGRTDDGSVVYVITNDVTFEAAAGSATQSKHNVHITCLSIGEVGNCGPSTINKMISLPSEITSIVQATSITGGQPRESDDALRNRAIIYLSSLAKCQPVALEHFASSFVASDQTRTRYAAIYEDVDRRGYSELVVDDGSILLEGRNVGTTEGRAVSGTVPGAGVLTIFHEGPAVSPIQTIERLNSSSVLQGLLHPDQFVSIPERGVVYVDPGVFQPGEIYRIRTNPQDPNQGYRVFTGALIPELQRAIEGDLNDPVTYPGLRAAGTRVRVLPPTIQSIGFDMRIVPVNGVSFVETADAVREAATEFVLTLRPGDSLYVSQLIDRVMDNPDVIDVKFFEHNIRNPGSSALSDKLASTRRHVLRPNPDDMLVIPPEDFDI